MTLTDLVTAYAALTAGVYSLTEAFRNWGPLKGVKNRVLAIVIGTVLSTLLTAAGLIDIPNIDGWREIAASVGLGLLAFGGAHGIHEAARRDVKK